MNELPLGFRFAGLHCGLKRTPQKQDVAIVASDAPCAAAGVFTRNLIFAAPVALDRERTPSEDIQAVVINSGNANACTGPRGFEDAKRMAAIGAEALGLRPEQVLVLSTGVIGQFLPMDKIADGLQRTAQRLDRTPEAVEECARGFWTTDTKSKIAYRSFEANGKTIRLMGVCKGAAMISPNMGTMLAVISTDAQISPATAKDALSAAVDTSFNCLSIDGHMSTNDTVLLLANGKSGAGPLAMPELAKFRSALQELCSELSYAIADDGEGATHVMNIHVRGCATQDNARQIARKIADSPLVKCAVSGGDPNWGRIVSAAGYAGVPFDPKKVSLTLQGVQLYRDGAPVEFDDVAVSQLIKETREVKIVLTLGEGNAEIRFWASDLTAEYVRLNADYRT